MKPGDKLQAADAVGTVKEGSFTHKIMVPFHLSGRYEVVEIAESNKYSVKEQVALIKDKRGSLIPLSMMFEWPIRRPVTSYRERLDPAEPLITRIRIIDTLFPVAKGGNLLYSRPFWSRQDCVTTDNKP